MFYKIALFCLYITSVFSIDHVYLKTPTISKENIIGTNVGIRPFRKKGIRIETQQVQDKLIVHNYGYGGSGLTLAFGGVLEVLDILDEHNILPKKTVAILGAGVVGLTTAYDLIKKGYEVHLYSDEWPCNLTSNVAAGIWSPLSFPLDLPEEKKQLHQRMEKNSEDRFLKSIGDCPEFAGVRMISAYSFTTQSADENHRLKQSEEIVAHFDNGVIKQGRKTKQLGIDGQLFMNDLYQKVKKSKASLKQCHFKSLEDVLDLEETVIINCTSIGSMTLFHDEEFIPIRGQLIYFTPQKEIDYFYHHTLDNEPNSSNLFFVSIYPWSDRMILGGVYEFNQTEPIIIPEVVEKLIKHAEHALSDNG